MVFRRAINIGGPFGGSNSRLQYECYDGAVRAGSPISRLPVEVTKAETTLIG